MATTPAPNQDGTNPVQNKTSEAGDDLYNAIMSQIEPELTTDQLPLLDERYADESAESAKERGLRYQAAFEEYDRQFAGYKADWEREWKQHRHEALESTEREERAAEEQKMQDLENKIQGS